MEVQFQVVKVFGIAMDLAREIFAFRSKFDAVLIFDLIGNIIFLE